MRLRAKALALLLLLLAQTTTTAPSGVDLAQNISSSLTQILFPLITIVIIIALPLLIFNVLAKSVLDLIK